MTTDDLLAYRLGFPILAHTNYLISNSLGAMPEAARGDLQRYADLWDEKGVRAWNEEWWDLGASVGDRLATILGVSEGSVSMQPNVTLASAVYLSCLTPRAGRRKVLTTDLQFPSLLYLLEQWCKQNGLELETLSSAHRAGVEPDTLLNAIDDGTEAVVISHVEFKTAYLNDANAVAARCRRHGSHLLLDVFQSAGVLPLRLREWGVEAAVGGCLKWLCGGPGNAFLYIDPEVGRDLEPRLTGWMAHPAPFAFEPPPVRRLDGAARFLNGTPTVPAHYAAIAGLDVVNEIGVELIRAKSLRLTQLLLDEASSRGWSSATPARREQRGGTVALDIEHGEQVSRELLARNIVVDYRPDVGLRVAPHFYNSEEDCRACVAEIARILADGSYRRHTPTDGGKPT